MIRPMHITLGTFLCMWAVVTYGTTSYFGIRSQSVNLARELVGLYQHTNLCETRHGFFAITPAVNDSFHGGRAACALFGADIINGPGCAPSINVSGTAVSNRGAHDWLADYFGLPRDYQSTLFFCPCIKNYLIDFNGYFESKSGFYFRAHAPVVHTIWALNFAEDAIIPGVLPYDPGYFDASSAPGVPRQNLVATATDFFSFGKVPTLTNVTFQPLQYGKFAPRCCCLTTTALSDIEIAAGYNIWCDDAHTLGLSLRTSIPTGNRPKGIYLFEPIVGSGGHWKLGGGINGQSCMWINEAQQRSFWLYIDARIQHLFAACQHRSFDLCGKPNSRYMLAQKLGPQRQPIHLIGLSDAGVEFQNQFAPVADITYSRVNVCIDYEVDAAITISYTSGNWHWDMGYEFWYNSAEHIKRCAPAGADPLDGATWALKGDAAVIGFAVSSYAGQLPVNLAAVEQGATINNGTNNYVGPNLNDGGINGIRPTANPGITNLQVLIGANGATGNLTVNDRTTIAGIPTRSSNPVVFLSTSSVDFVGIKALSHKFFTHFSHDWNCTQSTTAYAGLGFEIECGKTSKPRNCVTSAMNNNCVLSDCELFNPCSHKKRTPTVSISQWGIWFKGGAAFE